MQNKCNHALSHILTHVYTHTHIPTPIQHKHHSCPSILLLFFNQKSSKRSKYYLDIIIHNCYVIIPTISWYKPRPRPYAGSVYALLHSVQSVSVFLGPLVHMGIQTGTSAAISGFVFLIGGPLMAIPILLVVLVFRSREQPILSRVGSCHMQFLF